MEAPRRVTRELLEAIDALRAKGIPATEQAVAKWIEEHKPAPCKTAKPVYESQPEKPRMGARQAVSSMAPFTPAELEELAQPEPELRPARRNLGGRPAREEPWLEEAAKLVASGMTLRQTLKSLGVPFSEQDLNNIQRLVGFRKYLEKYRQGS